MAKNMGWTCSQEFQLCSSITSIVPKGDTGCGEWDYFWPFPYVHVGCLMWWSFVKTLWLKLSCWQGLEYTDCICCRGLRLPPPTKKSVLNMTLNWIWWWGCSSGNLGRVGYPFCAITPRLTLIWCGSIC